MSESLSMYAGTLESKWKGKKAIFLGDSITYGLNLADIENERFSNLLQNDLQLGTVYNYGISGTKVAKIADGDSSFSQRFVAMTSDADLIVIFGGTNDYGHTTENNDKYVPFGTFNDRVDTTFYGALHFLYKGIIEKYPGKTIIVITPMHRTAPRRLTGDDYTTNPDTGKNLRDYVNAIREVAEYYGIPVLDFFKNLPINPNIEIMKTTYFPDGLHPNAVGHRKIADAIINFIHTL